MLKTYLLYPWVQIERKDLFLTKFGSHLLSGKPSSIHVHRTRIAILIPSQTNLGQNLLPTNWFGNPYLEFQPTKLLEITAPRGKLKCYRQSFALNYSWHASEYSCFCFSGSFFIFRLLCIFSNCKSRAWIMPSPFKVYCALFIWWQMHIYKTWFFILSAVCWKPKCPNSHKKETPSSFVEREWYFLMTAFVNYVQ